MDLIGARPSITSTLTSTRVSTMGDGEDLKERVVILEKLLSDPASDCYIERLLDVIVACVNDFRRAHKSKENVHILTFCERFLGVATHLQSLRRQPNDFTPISLIGHGAFGRVELVREITTGRVCAMKIMKKTRLLTQQTDYWAEREVMSRGESPWIVQLYYAFQDLNCLYMVMEYVPGGNLVGWMQEVDVISEPACRFYIAETVMALLDLHEMGFIHRDLKPDNLLLDCGGHVKLADFGTAIRVDSLTKVIHTDVAVGTPDYLSPEVLLSQGSGGGEYGFEVDWWALGVVVYELLYGDTPFYSETLVNTYSKIMSHANNLHFPDNVTVSDAALNFMKALLCAREKRLGVGPSGWKNVLNHCWFSSDWANEQKLSNTLDLNDLYLLDWTWETIRACRAPFQPNLSSETDTSYFQVDTDDEDTSAMAPSDGGSVGRSAAKQGSPVPDSMDKFLKKFPGVQLAFAGFSFSSSHPDSVSLLNGLQPNVYPLPPHSSTDPNCMVNGDSSPSLSPPPRPPLSIESTVNVTGSKIVNGPSMVDVGVGGAVDVVERKPSPVPDYQRELVQELGRLQSELDDAKLCSDKLVELERDLAASIKQREVLEIRLAENDMSHRKALEEAEILLKSVRDEATRELARLQIDLAKWKTIASTLQDASRDKSSGPTKEIPSSQQRSTKCIQTDYVNTPISSSISPPSILSSFAGNINVPKLDFEQQQNANSSSSDMLLSHVQQISKRAHEAETAARESADLLETEQRFHNVYKSIVEEKSEQIQELQHTLDEMHQYFEANQINSRRHYEAYCAAHRALIDERHRCARYLRTAKDAEKRALSASRRATTARRDADNLRNEMEELKRFCSQKQNHCDLAVQKLNEVIRDPAALQAMYAAQKKDGSAAAMMSSGTKVWGSVFSDGSRNRIASQVKEIKRLQNDNQRLNRDLIECKRETKNLHDTLFALHKLNDDQRCYHHSRESSHNSGGLPNLRNVNASIQFFEDSQVATGTERQQQNGTIVVEQSPLDVLTNRNSMIHQLTMVDNMITYSDNSAGAAGDGSSAMPSAMDSRPMEQQELYLTDFAISDFLELGTKRPNRTKKLAWNRHYVQLTETHLLVWGSSMEPTSRVPPPSPYATLPRIGWTSNTSAFTPTPPPPASTDTVTKQVVHEVPLRWLHYVRCNSSTEMLHERAGNIGYTFTVAFSMLPDSVDKVKPLDSSHSSTLVRKGSTGSTSFFSTHSPSIKRTPAYHDPYHSSTLRSSHGNLNFVDSSSTSTSPSSPLPSVLVVRGHRFQPMQFNLFTSCDWCHKSSWRPTLYQCVHCQFKLHSDHLMSGPYMFTDCSKGVSTLLFRCSSTEAQERWVNHIAAAIRFARSKSTLSFYRPTPPQVTESNVVDQSPVSSLVSHTHANSFDTSMTMTYQKPPQPHRSKSNTRTPLNASTHVDDLRHRPQRLTSRTCQHTSSSPDDLTINPFDTNTHCSGHSAQISVQQSKQR